MPKSRTLLALLVPACFALAACNEDKAAASAASAAQPSQPAPAAQQAAPAPQETAPAAAPQSVSAPATEATPAAAEGDAAAAADVPLGPDGKPLGDTVVTAYYANGFSPAWEAHIDGDTIRFSVPEIETPDNDLRTAKVERLPYAKGVEYNGQDGKVDFTLNVRSRSCTKSLNKDEKSREFTATFRYGDKTYKGCADAVRRGH